MPQEISQSLLQAYMPDFCEEVDLVISPSQGMEKVLRQYGVNCHIEVIPNGVDLTRFHNAKSLSRTDFGFSEEDTLYDMWKSDNITDDNEYLDWKKE